jgi:hypothetical protein
MRKTSIAVVFLGLMALGRAHESWIDRDEADKDLPPWIQYYNKLKGSPKLLPWQQDEPDADAITAIDSHAAGGSMFRG